VLVLAGEMPRGHSIGLRELAGDDGVSDSIDVTLVPFDLRTEHALHHPSTMRLSGVHAALESFQPPRKQNLTAGSQSETRLFLFFGFHIITSKTMVSHFAVKKGES
jgi:hypothetical protein